MGREVVRAEVAQAMKMMLSVLVSSWNQLSSLKLVMASYGCQTMKRCEVVVSDDGSDDGTKDWVESLGLDFDVRFVGRKHEGYGLAQAWNEAAAVARGERLLFTNADILHAPGSFEAHMEVEGVGAGLVAGIGMKGVEKLDEDVVTRWDVVEKVRRDNPLPGNLDLAEMTDPNFNVVGVWSSNLSVSAAMFHEVGGFSERFFGKWGCEDYDLADRLARHDVVFEWVRHAKAFHMWHPVAAYAKEMGGCEEYING